MSWHLDMDNPDKLPATEEKKTKVEKIRDDVYIQPGIFGGYSMVYPFKTDGKWHKRNITMFFIKFFGIILLALLLLTAQKKELKLCRDMMNDNVTACKMCAYQGGGNFSNTIYVMKQPSINLSFSLSGGNSSSNQS